ncbi:MAG TPA: ketoacyl-ACP synthase III [Fermentimonas caenicola]|jgi:3-oxoacyl-[acyl-carrier-protein] synthase-3|uniref:3-oxoacyl-ACP synthase III family protein n=1 Tax=Lascolabacillus TaxID=1924067 RepID=UPI0006B3309F|nr:MULTISPECIES: ketoacyl-ACP synthase III [Lascolabacillus]MBP7104218.1 ketoacyl-ACP synthase III [Fermentimonas sp.]MDI9626366.1 ketoacyl-ACP synthase III [Bacteroidota bacterium]TAH61955.1 MAG: ketoacyl-ACP synthase III [Fermentimonas caenicola]MDD2606385.1 ketoacyl-ACP synthase III [Lascolabacillus sp.]MDD3657738.1 ketoacyl-ACP synthase III [Lascolabacillus sp.]
MKKIYSVFTGTGSYVPTKQIKNDFFHSNEFYDSTGKKLDTPNEEITRKFEEITTIAERRYAEDDQVTSDLALIASNKAIESAGIDKEELDYIIFAHNFGETRVDDIQIDVLPTMAARLKQKLGIRNPSAIAYDVLFGCPGWVQAVIQADYYIKSGDAKKILVVGADVLSRISDPHDRDSMIYADGAGAAIMEARESETPIGILGHNSRSDALDYAKMLYMGYSYEPGLAKKKVHFLKMNGRRLYQYALSNVPNAIKAGLDKLNLNITDISKVLIHQANGKMDDAILKRLFELYNINEVPEYIMPMTISWLGNSSVATVPTLLDMIIRDTMDDHQLESGDIIVLASVGAGMNINNVVYKLP